MTLKDTHPFFVANDARGSREETAILLVGTADEFGIDQRDIKAVHGGFRITADLSNALAADYEDGGYDEDEDEVDPGSIEALAGAENASEAVQEAVEEVAQVAALTKSASTPKKTSGTRAAKTTQKKQEQ